MGEHKISNAGLDCNDFDTTDCNAGHQDFDIEELIIHPSYNSPEVFRNDIALIRIKGKINLNSKCRIILVRIPNGQIIVVYHISMLNTFLIYFRICHSNMLTI